MATFSQSSSNGSIDSPPPKRRKGKGGGRRKDGEDDEEIRDRRIHCIVEGSRVDGSANSSPIDERRLIAQHTGNVGDYLDCLKLSAANKINTKNAFNLGLIDCMSAVFRSQDAEMSFQMAGTTLDASAKIYAYRVDNVHRETFKMAGGLGRAETANATSDDDDDAGGDNQDRVETAPKAVKKRRKKVTKGNTIELNEKNLNVNVGDSQFAGDALFDKVRSNFDEGGSSGLFLNTLSTAYDSNRLMLHCLGDLPTRRVSAANINPPVDTSEITELLSKASFADVKSICPQLGDFNFVGWQPDETLDNAKDSGHKNSIDDAPVQPSAGMYAIELPPLPPPDFGLEQEDDFDDDHGGITDFDEAEQEETQTGAITLDAVASAVSAQPLEYSYFDPKVASTWDNPSHWRLGEKLNSLKREHSTSTDDDGVSITRKGRKTANGRKNTGCKRKPKRDIKFGQPKDVDAMVVFGTTSTVFPISKVEQWKTISNIFLEDPDDKTEAICPLCTKPDFTIPDDAMDESSETLAPFDDDERLANDQEPQDNVDKGVEADFGALSVVGGETDDDQDQDEIDQGDVNNATLVEPATSSMSATVPTDNMFHGDLLEQPYKVNKISVAFERQAKKIDVRRVKRSIWKELTTGDGNATAQGRNLDNTMISPKKLSKPKRFSKLCAELKGHVPPSTAENLSVPIVFACLLHLCNEKDLVLQGDNAKDLIISSGNTDDDDSND